MQNQKTVQANYSAELAAVIVAEYVELIQQHKDNKIVLDTLSKKHGKTVPSLRAKLASLKVYKSADTASTSKSVPSKITKEQLAQSISKLVGQQLDGLEVAPKQVLLAIADKLLEQNDKINDLILDITADNQVNNKA